MGDHSTEAHGSLPIDAWTLLLKHSRLVALKAYAYKSHQGIFPLFLMEQSGLLKQAKGFAVGAVEDLQQA